MMPRAMFSEVVVKSKFIYFSKSLELNRLADETRSSKGGSLNVFFTTKTQKPFQTTVSEGGHGNEFLLKILCKLNPEDAYSKSRQSVFCGHRSFLFQTSS